MSQGLRAASQVIMFLALTALPALVFSQGGGTKLYFDVSAEVAAGDEFSVRAMVDSAEPLNAYSLDVVVSGGAAEIASVSDGSSIVDVWRGQPAVSGEGKIELRGGNFTPFSGEGGELITINLRAVAEGEITLSFENAEVFAADGRGTRIVPAADDLSIVVSERSADGARVFSVVVDEAPPEIAALSFEKDPFNSDRKILGFLARDRGSGIKETEVRTMKYLWWSEWRPVAGPVAVPLSVWLAEVRAVDNRGNASSRIVYDGGASARLAVSALSFLGATLAILYFARSRRKRFAAPVDKKQKR